MDKKWNSDAGAFRDVNLTPLIDVSLVLVVILLLATPLAFESSIQVRNTATSGRKAEEKKDLKRVELHVVDDVLVEVNELPVTRAELSRVLRPLLGEESGGKVSVSCEDVVSHGAFVNVLDQAKLAGATDIAVMGK